MFFKKTRLQMLASDFTETDNRLRRVLYKFFKNMDDEELNNTNFDPKNKGFLCAMLVNYILGDKISRDDARAEIVSVYKQHGLDIPKNADRIIRQNPELLWIVVQFLRGRLNVKSAFDFPDDPSKFLETEPGKRIWNLLDIYGGEVKEAIDYELLKQRLSAFEQKTFL